MDDAISRQAAIDELKKISFPYWFECGEYLSEDTREIEIISSSKALEVIEALPSAQPERPSEIQDILDYLDTVLHPIISPEHWNVYSELHDMISTLSSAQLEQRWIPVGERLPEEDTDILVTYVDGEEVRIIPVNYARGTWFDCIFDNALDSLKVTAWMPVPESYKGRQP